jgi:flagellar protein FliO/FliZ
MAAPISSRISVITLATLLPALACAQSVPPPQDLGGSVFQMLFGLAVVIALLIASLWLLKRLSAPRGEAAGLLRVVAGTAVGPRERVVVLEVGGTWLVLGVASGRVNALAEIPRQDFSANPAGPKTSDFAGRLRRMIEGSRAS